MNILGKIFCLIPLVSVLPAFAGAYSIKSPDGKIAVAVDGADELRYSVKVADIELISPSLMGVVMRDRSMGQIISTDCRTSSFAGEWTQPWGENKHISCVYNELAVVQTSAAGEFITRFRAFDDGIAFRYEWNMKGNETIVITDELTEFNLQSGSMTWSIPGSFESYEHEFRSLVIDDVEDANTPFTLQTPQGIFASIHEAALYDYPEMTLCRSEADVLKAELAPLPDGVKAYVPSKFSTPWRTVQIASDAVGLINSAMILNLNEPSKIADTSWIKPQKYVGIWWGMHLGTQTWVMGPRHGATTENAVKYIDFAAANNIQGVLFEGWNEGWENWGGNQHFDYSKAYADFDIKFIADYAAKHGVELWAHNETGGNIPEYEAAMDSAFAYYQSLGIHTLKTGYAGGFKGGYYHHSQYGVKHYQRVVELAAKYGLMIDAHEPIKETGIRRTWPNMMTREGARGMEWNAWSAGNSADYLCILPFTRLLSGPMDYTPGIFDIDYSRAKADKGRLEWNGPNADCCIKTTLARQIANWVIIYSPLQMAADQIENYEGHPAFQFFRDFDADCDWSRALQGEIGKYIVVARRAGEKYFLGAGTDSEARTLSVNLDFLKTDVTYRADIYCDLVGSVNPEDVCVISKSVTAADTLEVAMNSAGGQAVVFTPMQ